MKLNSSILPKDWKLVQLGEICQKVNSVKRKEKETNEEFLYLDIGGIDNLTNKILNHKSYKWGEAPSRAQQIIFKDDILFSTVRTYMKNVAIVENHIYNGQIASSGFCVIRSDKKLAEPKFVFYYVISQKFLQPLNELQTGSSYPAVRDKDVLSQPFPLPTKSTQLAIVSKIEELFSELDKGIEQLKNTQQQLKTYRQAVLKWAFEGRFTNENVEAGRLPKNWVTTQMNKISSFLNGDRSKNYPNRNEYVEIGIPFINTGHIEPNGLLDLATMNYISREKFNSLNGGKIKNGDLVYCLRGATIGKIAFVDQFNEGAIASSLVIIRPIESKAVTKYLFYYLKSPLGRECIKQFDNGTAQPNLSAKSLSLYAIPIPTAIEDQNAVVHEIESRLSIVDKMEESIQKSLQQAETLRQSILKMAFEGLLVTTDTLNTLQQSIEAIPA